MKIVDLHGYRHTCPKCGCYHELERGDAKSGVMLDYHGYHEFLAAWSCPACGNECITPLKELPWDWHDEIKQAGGHAGMDADKTPEAETHDRQAYNCAVRLAQEEWAEGRKPIFRAGGMAVSFYRQRNNLPDPLDRDAKEVLG